MELSTSLDLLAAFVIGSFATFMVAKTLTQSVLLKSPRNWLVAKLVVSEKKGIRKKGFRVKLAYLIGCPVCAGAWISLVIAGLSTTSWPWQFGVVGWLLWASIAGAQLTLQSLVPGEPTKGVE